METSRPWLSRAWVEGYPILLPGDHFRFRRKVWLKALC